MTWRRATQSDVPCLREIMESRLRVAMFPLSNLDAHGLDGDAPRSMSFWIAGDNLLGLSREGMAFPVADADADWSALAPQLSGRVCIGALGEAGAAAGFSAATGIDHAPATHSTDEPSYALTLSDMILPEITGYRLTPITPDLRDMATAWRASYEIETMHLPPAKASAVAPSRIDGYIAADSHRILWHNDRPAAMTGFNARHGTTVQIGGVYTPPDQRGRGLARRAVALHLDEARAEGATHSFLTAANRAAARAYEAIGYAEAGRFRFHILAEPVTLS